jgi:hypothetical protein
MIFPHKQLAQIEEEDYLNMNFYLLLPHSDLVHHHSMEGFLFCELKSTHMFLNRKRALINLVVATS